MAVLTVAPVNDAPTIVVSRHPALGPGAAGATTAPVTVSAFLAGVATDVDNPDLGVELLPTSSRVGRWQYSTDGGTTWKTATTTIKLDATAQVRFAASAHATAGTFDLTFKA
jgi:hypothetical protein